MTPLMFLIFVEIEPFSPQHVFSGSGAVLGGFRNPLFTLECLSSILHFSSDQVQVSNCFGLFLVAIQCLAKA